MLYFYDILKFTQLVEKYVVTVLPGKYILKRMFLMYRMANEYLSSTCYDSVGFALHMTYDDRQIQGV